MACHLADLVCFRNGALVDLRAEHVHFQQPSIALKLEQQQPAVFKGLNFNACFLSCGRMCVQWNCDGGLQVPP